MQTKFSPEHFNISAETWATAIRFKKDQQIEELKSIIQKNYPIIKDHFHSKRGSIISDADMDDICISIMWHWIRAIELGQIPNGKDMNEVLRQKRKDFDHYNKEIIVNLLRARYPNQYTHQCEFILDLSQKEVTEYVSWLEMMYNK
jgi:hypothetical protein